MKFFLLLFVSAYLFVDIQQGCAKTQSPKVNTNILLAPKIRLPERGFGLGRLTDTVIPAKNIDQKGNIAGKVTDNKNLPIQYASISLYKRKDSSLVRGTLTNNDGYYALENIRPGEYYIQVYSIGYSKAKTGLIKLTDGISITLPEITLPTEGTVLDEVVVSSSKPLIETQIDKMVINVANSVLAVGNTAMDVLQRAPGVAIDKDDNIILRGKAGVQIMIDGKPTYLSEAQLGTLLRSTDAGNIQSIEIITNPSSKYDAAGNSGIIDIRMKKNQNFGTNGTITAGVGYGKYGKLENSLSINHRQRAFNVFANYAFSDRTTFFNVAHDREITGSVTNTFIGVHSYILNNTLTHNYKAGIDFFLNKNNTLGLIAGGIHNNSTRDLNGLTLIGTAFNGQDSSVVTKSTGPLDYDFGSYNVNYKSVLDSTGTNLTLNLDYIRSSGIENYDYASHYNTPTQPDYRSPVVFITETPIIADIYTGKVDFTHLFTKTTQLDVGLKTSYIKTDNNFSFNFLTGSGNYTNDPLRSNHFKYKETISAGYANLKTELFPNFTVQAGLRLENTHSQGNSINSASTITNNYLDLFPTLFLKQKLSPKQTVGASYSRRIDRPTYSSLNPFVYYVDQFSYTQGNPYLKPQYTNSYEINSVFKDKYIISLNHRHTADVMTQVFFVNPNTKALFETRENMATQNYLNLNVNAPVAIENWWQTNNNLTIFWNKFHTPNLNGLPFSLAKTSWQLNSLHAITLSKTSTAEVNGTYTSAAAYGVRILSLTYGVDLGISQSFLNKQLSLKLSVNDIFNTRPKRFSTSALSEVAYTYNLHSRWESRVIRLSASWRFGNKNVKVNEKTGGSEAERNRL